MPVQTYHWNKRAVVEQPPDAAEPGEVAVVAPEGPATPPPLPVAAETWAPPPAAPLLPSRAAADPTFGGLALACFVALAMPLGLTFAIESMSWRHAAGTNTTLLGVVAV